MWNVHGEKLDLVLSDRLVGSEWQRVPPEILDAWAAILFTPTLICAIYGMNFDTMPRLHWTFGYPLAFGLMLLVAPSGNLGLGEHR